MASLTVLKGSNSSQRIKLDSGDEWIMGRAPECQIHIPNNAVSRQHAKIVRNPQGYWIEDLKSRNKTLVNNREIENRTLLKDNDKIKVCDWLFAFHNESTPVPGPIEIEDGETDSPSTVHASVSRMSQQELLETQPSEKLRALLEVSNALGKMMDEEILLPQIADILFTVFRQADRCFIIIREEQSEALIPKVIKTRRANTETSARFSKTIVKRCLESGQSLLFEDAQSGSQMALSASIAEFRIRSVMCAPLVNQDGNAFGLIQLDSQDRNKTFTQDDLKLLVGVANQAAIAIDNAKLHRNAVAGAVKQEEEELARKVQRSFLPAKLPDVPGYQFYAFYQAAKNVGGDYYDFIPHNRGQQLGIVLGDVAGKGMPAALLMAKLSAEARYCMLLHPEIAQAVARLNEQLLQAGMMDRFVTFSANLLDSVQNQVTLVNAGHMSPLIFREATKTLEDGISTDQSGFPLGMIEGMDYESAQIQLNPGDCAIIFTDGVTDALSMRDEQFGTERVKEAILGDATLTPFDYTPQEIGKRLISAMQKHSAGQYQNDDIALVVFGRLAEAQLAQDSGRVATASGPMTQTFRRPSGIPKDE